MECSIPRRFKVPKQSFFLFGPWERLRKDGILCLPCEEFLLENLA